MDTNHRIKWCQAVPSCGYAVMLHPEAPPSGCRDVKCYCGVRFCFSCELVGGHAPATCEMHRPLLERERLERERPERERLERERLERERLERGERGVHDWMMIDDIETAQDKQWPSCNLYVHKIDGCNHMTCKCGAHFCWLCTERLDQDGIFTYPYAHNCSVFRPRPAASVADQGASPAAGGNARLSLPEQRMEHHYARYHAHGQFSGSLLDLRRVALQRYDATGTGSADDVDVDVDEEQDQLSTLVAAITGLINAHQFLRNSHCFVHNVLRETLQRQRQKAGGALDTSGAAATPTNGGGTGGADGDARRRVRAAAAERRAA